MLYSIASLHAYFIVFSLFRMHQDIGLADIPEATDDGSGRAPPSPPSDSLVAPTPTPAKARAPLSWMVPSLQPLVGPPLLPLVGPEPQGPTLASLGVSFGFRPGTPSGNYMSSRPKTRMT